MASIEPITERADLLIRRMILEPGERMFWHIDTCHRFTVVVRGEALTIEFLDGSEPVEVEVRPGLADWDAPEPRVHRAVNTGPSPYEEVATFYRVNAADPQPRVEGPP